MWCMNKAIKIIVLFSSIFFCMQVNASSMEESVSAGKIVHDCTQENNKALNMACSSYMVGLRDGLMVGVLEDWKLADDKMLSANTIINLMVKYVHDNPLEGDNPGMVVAAKSLEQAGVIKRRF